MVGLWLALLRLGRRRSGWLGVLDEWLPIRSLTPVDGRDRRCRRLCRWIGRRLSLRLIGWRSGIIVARTMPRTIGLILARWRWLRCDGSGRRWRIGTMIAVVAVVTVSVGPIAGGRTVIAVVPIMRPVVRWPVIPVPIGILAGWRAMVAMIGVMVTIMMAVIATTTRTMIRRNRKIVGGNAIAHIADVAGIIRIGGISGRIKIDVVTGYLFRFVDRELEAAVEREFCADDLVGKRGALDEFLSAVDVTLVDEIGNDVAAALLQLLGRQLVGLVHKGEKRGGSAVGRPLIIIIIGHDTARTQRREQAKNEGQKQGE